MALPTIDFRSIREHNGSLDQGFEELVAELIPSLDDEVNGLNVVRHGSPDSGVEAYVELEDGTIWGWQAKYFFRIDNPQLKQMKESIETAFSSFPTLARYTFVLPMNLPAGQHGVSAKKKLEDAFEDWQSQAADKGRKIEFRFIGESQLIDILTQEQHVGRVFYWFDRRLMFSDAWMRKLFKQAMERAGPRYTEEFNVDVPIRFAFEGLGLTGTFEKDLSERIRQFARSTQRWRSLPNESALGEDIESDVKLVASTAQKFLVSWRTTDISKAEAPNWEPFLATISHLQGVLSSLLGKLHHREQADAPQDQSPSQSEARSRSDFVVDLRRRAREIYEAASRLQAFIDSPASCLAATPALFLNGDWGTGKTHLLCDVAARRLAEGQPTVLLLGEELDDRSLRTSIPAQLGLADLTMDDFLGTLNTAGRVADCRALLVLDAVNDVAGRQQVRNFLAGLAAEAEEYSHLAVAVSCRTSYTTEVLPQNPEPTRPEDLGFVVVEHAGFAGLEFEAATAFFEHWDLEIPEAPVLMPEYSNPLFLRLLCKTLSLRGQKNLPKGSSGVTELFSGYLSAVNRVLADETRCDFRKESDLVGDALRNITESMIRENVDYVPFSEFEDLCKELLPNRPWSDSLEKGLIDESMVVRDVGKEGEVVRLSYQRLGDHLQAARLLSVLDDGDLQSRVSDLATHPWHFRQSSGLLEALAVQLPESRSRELFEIVDDPHAPAVHSAVLKSLDWRKAQHCAGEDLSSYLDSIGGHRSDFHDPVLEAKLRQSIVPDHPFNAHALDALLRRLKLPARDVYWTVHINSCDSGKCAIYRIIDWALSSQQNAASDQVAWLASLTLTWCLAASNRGLRDRATKALVSLLSWRLPMLIQLLDHFREVDDPYVSERLYAVAYGCALASHDDRHLSDLAEYVYGQVFSGGAPQQHVMLRDYACGVIEWGITQMG